MDTLILTIERPGELSWKDTKVVSLNIDMSVLEQATDPGMILATAIRGLKFPLNEKEKSLIEKKVKLP